MFRFLHLTDLHLGYVPRRLSLAKAQERRTRRDSLLTRAVNFALSEASSSYFTEFTNGTARQVDFSANFNVRVTE